jgi:hypothetical protein
MSAAKRSSTLFKLLQHQHYSLTVRKGPSRIYLQTRGVETRDEAADLLREYIQFLKDDLFYIVHDMALATEKEVELWLHLFPAWWGGCPYGLPTGDDHQDDTRGKERNM